MINAANGSTAVTIDPTLLALIPIVSVLLTIGAGLAGAAIQSRREHARWIREERYKAFQAARLAAERYRDLGRVVTALKAMTPPDSAVERESGLRKAAEAKAQLQAFRETVDEAFTPLLILGPQRVMRSLGDFRAAVDRGEGEAADAAERRMISQMRRAVKVRA